MLQPPISSMADQELSKVKITHLLPLAVLALCGCTPQPDAIIKWHKVGACNGGLGQGGDPSTSYNAGPNAAYVIFAIEGVDNSQVSTAWTIDPTQFHVGSAKFDPGLMIYKYVLGPFALINSPIPAKGVLGFSTNAYGAMVVTTTATDGASEADTASYSLQFTPSSGAPGVVMEESPAASTAYTPDCASVQLK
jgi:hypothetical protein